jgi:predicted nucleotidyltransferase
VLRRSAVDGRLDRLAEEQELSLIVLFGSAVTDVEPRDVDIAVLPRTPQGFDRARCTVAFIDLLHTDEVDLLDLSTAGVLARARALGAGEPLYEDTAGEYARQQLRAVPLAMELGWLTDLELELLAAG